MNTTAATIPTATLSGRRLLAIRMGWWVLLLLYTIFAVFYYWQLLTVMRYDAIWGGVFPYLIVINIVIDIISWYLALTLFLRRSNEWIIVLVSLMFLSAPAGPFLFWIFNYGWGNFSAISAIAAIASQIIAQPFDIFSTIVRVGVFLTFPTGQWISSRAKRLFWANIVFLIVINLFLSITWIAISRDVAVDHYVNLEQFGRVVESLGGSIFRLIAAYLLFLHYRKMQNSIQRQQIKWIVVFFIGGVCVSALVALFYAPLRIIPLFTLQENFYKVMSSAAPWMAVPSSILNLGLVIAFSVAIFRYRLWDVDVLINKALVYSGLTAVLGGLIFISVTLVSQAIEQWFGEESSIWAVVISAVPVATAFTPLRDALQKWVDKYFKPEEVNFSGTFVEFTPEVRDLLTTSQIVQTISEQVKKQLNVDFARVCLVEQDNNLHYVESNPTSAEHSSLSLEAKLLAQLKDGKVVVDSDGIPYSLLVPLVVPRARIPDFLGAIVLGRRASGKGYSTQILNNLRSLGADAGKAIYLSQLREQSKQKAAL